MSSIVSAAGCVSSNVPQLPTSKPEIFSIDGSGRQVRPFVDVDRENFEVRFENFSLLEVADSLNALSDRFVVIAAQSVSSSANLSDQVDSDSSHEVSVSGYFQGTLTEILRDLSIKWGLAFDRIGNHFYLSTSQVDLSYVQTSAVIETSLSEEELDKIKTAAGSAAGADVNFTLVSSKLLITGRFYSVQRFYNYVLELNEIKRSYVVRLVFVRLDRSSISRLEADLKASPLDLVSSGYDLYDLFQAQLDFSLTRDKSSNYSEQLLYCTDGKKSQLQIGSSFSRENRAVSDYGTSTTTGYQTFEDGIDIELTPYRSLGGVVEIDLKFGNSKFSDTSNLAKNKVDLSYERLTLLENRLYYVASLTESNQASARKLVGVSNSNDNKVLTCWLVISPVKPQNNFNVNDNF